ncbi:MAG: PAS domain S-box protein [Methylococcaceae bacterium]|nr:PAS domain S-box protein [Methylococcaceae bacterium]
MKTNNKKSMELEKLLAYFFRLVLLSFTLLLIFILLIFRSWHMIDKNQQHLSQYYLPSISVIFQMQNIFNKLEHKNLDSLNIQERTNTLRITFQYSSSNDNKYQLGLLSKKLATLEQSHSNLNFKLAFSRFEHQVNKLLNNLTPQKQPLSETAEKYSALLLQAQNNAEQLRRLYELEVSKLSINIKQQQQELLWEIALFIVLFFFIFRKIINSSSTAIKKMSSKQEQQHNETLEKERLLFKLIFESSPNGLIIVNNNGKIINANQEMERLFKYSHQALIGRDIEDLMPQRFKKGHKTNIQHYLEQPTERPMAKESKLLAVDKNDKEFPIEIGLTPLKLGKQQELYILATIADISEHKQAQQELLASKNEAEKANKAKSAFLANMSHELRTPLNAILGFGQLMEMEDDPPLTLEQLDNTHEIIKAGYHLLSLINEVLDLSKIEAGKVKISMQKFSLSEVLDECFMLIQPLTHKTEINIDNKITTDYLVYADKLRLKQVLLNLMTNAVKYNRENGTVTLKAESPSKQKVRISIIDKGKGISTSEQKRLFQAFERLGAESTRIQGTGIGLVVTKQLIELMEGNIGIDSIPDVGSTFWIEIKGEEMTKAHREIINSIRQQG